MPVSTFLFIKARKMPHSHPKYGYINELIERKNIDSLKEEKEIISRIICNYQEELTTLNENPTSVIEEKKSRVRENINQEIKILNYIEKSLKNLLEAKNS